MGVVAKAFVKGDLREGGKKIIKEKEVNRSVANPIDLKNATIRKFVGGANATVEKVIEEIRGTHGAEIIGVRQPEW